MDFLAAFVPFVNPTCQVLAVALLGGIYWRSGAIKETLRDHINADAVEFRSLGNRILHLERRR